jgi:hypothetical protein
MKLYLHELVTSEARAASAALALMMRAGVTTWSEYDSSALPSKTAHALEDQRCVLDAIRAPIKVKGMRTASPCISVAVCQKCHGWTTIQLRNSAKLKGYRLSSDAIAKLQCVVTNKCDGQIEVAIPGDFEGRVTNTTSVQQNKEAGD